jgi:cephalosporin hydroxylase
MDMKTWFFSDNPYNPLTNTGDYAVMFDGIITGTVTGSGTTTYLPNNYYKVFLGVAALT